MQDFLSGVNFIYLVTLATAAISGWYGYSKYRYEKKLEKFKETNTDLFNKDDKQLVLAAIATLSIFKKDKQFEKNVTDVLLSRLYTELDYDVTNAIGNALLQYSNRNELIEIASKILEINRNFFVQTNPIKQRGYDIDKMMSDLNKLQTKADTTSTDKSDIGLETKLDMARTSFQEALKVIFPKQQYELMWHKQTTADTYAMVIRRAHLEKVGEGLDIQLYQNDFNYVYMAQFKTSSCSLIRSALSAGVYADVDFLNISLIYQCYFQRSYFNDSSFVGGKMVDTTFDTSTFENVKFENMDFSKTTFYQCSFSRTRFVNCKGLDQVDFSGAIRKDESCEFPQGISVPLPPPPPPPETQQPEKSEAAV
jgi:uncharacterized protein YjbI with pentapeptide repeats